MVILAWMLVNLAAFEKSQRTPLTIRICPSSSRPKNEQPVLFAVARGHLLLDPPVVAEEGRHGHGLPVGGRQAGHVGVPQRRPEGQGALVVRVPRVYGVEGQLRQGPWEEEVWVCVCVCLKI